jgi:hypothetical protein
VNLVSLGRERGSEPVERVDGLPVGTERAKWSRFIALAVTCRGRPRDKCGTNGPADSAFRLYRASDLRLCL